jgi:hypothetical protein
MCAIGSRGEVPEERKPMIRDYYFKIGFSGGLLWARCTALGFHGRHVISWLAESWLLGKVSALWKVKLQLSLCFFVTEHQGVSGEWRYSSTHSLTPALDRGE